MYIVIIITAAQSVQRLFPRMREDAHATRQCVVIDALVHFTPSVQKTLLSLLRFLTVTSSPRGNRRNYKAAKFKVCSWLKLPITVET